MKKTTLLRETAYLVPPQIADGFVPPTGFDFKISVSLHEVDVKIYGFTGQSWELLHNTDGLIPSYFSDVDHQKYYFESKTGSEQTIRVSFLSSDDAEGLGIRTGATPQTRKFYDIEEIPVYNGSRDGAMLTVMSNGSLAWLLANESFIVPSEGGSPAPAIAGTFLEELTTSLNNINGAQFSNGIFSKIATSGNQGATIDLESEGIVQFNADGSRVDEELTLSFWFRPDAQAGWNTGWRYVAGNGGQSGNEFRLAVSENSNGNIEFRPIIENLWTGSPRAAGSRAFTAGEWYHIALTYTSNGSGYDLKMFVDGVKGAELLNQNMNLMKFPNQKKFGMGGYSYGGSISANSAPIHSIDSLQIGDGVALTEAQVALIAGQSDRQMSIETAAASGASAAPTGAGTFLEEFVMFGGGTVTDGVLSTSAASPSYYKKSGMVAPSTTATTAVFSMWFNPGQSQMGLYSDQHYPSQVDFGLRMFSSSLLHISTPVGGANGVTLATPLTLNEWHHALVTVETDIAYTSTSSKSMTVKLFIDGEEVYTKTGNSSTKRIRAYAGIANGTKHYIGAENYNGSVSYKGDGQFDFMEWVDDVTLSDAQILAMYNGGTRGWSVAGAVQSPSYLESDATLYGDANLSNGSLVLDGTGDYGVIADGFRFTDKMTTSVWFKTTATGDRRIYSSHVRGMGGADFRNGFFARLNNGQLKYRHPAGGTGELTGPSGLNDGAWHHLALSWEASVGYTLYVDGSQAAAGGAGVSDGYASGWGLYIGANPWSRTSPLNEPYAFFDGEIKNFEVENEVLTSQQVTDLYNAGV